MEDKQNKSSVPDSGRFRRDDNGASDQFSDIATDAAKENEHQEQVVEEIKAAGNVLARMTAAGASWQRATEIVYKVRPVPALLWVVTRSVFGRSGEIGEPDPMMFTVVRNLILKASTDKVLGESIVQKRTSLSEAVQVVGADVAGALCFIHAVCRRISSAVSERVWRPLLDDALLRAHIGFHVGTLSRRFSAGQGMIAGFSGRAGLAIQIASSSQDKASRALTALASGTEIDRVCLEVYGCDPLQVSALTLIAGGCHRDIAMGISAFNSGKADQIKHEQYTWLAAFSIVEHLRMGRLEQIDEEMWWSAGFDPSTKEELIKQAQLSLRKGHGWSWVVKPLSVL